MRQNKKGFTLAELLIVVAIIAVLVAISIPIFSNQLEKSRQATDLANIRSVYAQVMSDAITDTPPVNEGGTVYSTPLKKTREWTPENLAVLTSLFGSNMDPDPVSGGTAWVEYHVIDKVDVIKLKYEGGNSGGDNALSEQIKKIVSVDANASEDTKKVANSVAKAYLTVTDTTKAYMEEHSTADRQGLKKASEGSDYNFRIYTVAEDGSLTPEGDDSHKGDTWNSAYKMPSDGSAVIDGKTVTWKKGNVIQVAYRVKGQVDISVATDSGRLWAN